MSPPSGPWRGQLQCGLQMLDRLQDILRRIVGRPENRNLPLLHALLADSDEVRDRAWQGIYDWHRRHGSHGWIKPSAECQAEISRVWPEVRDRDDAPDWAVGKWSSLKRWIEDLIEEVVQ